MLKANSAPFNAPATVPLNSSRAKGELQTPVPTPPLPSKAARIRRGTSNDDTWALATRTYASFDSSFQNQEWIAYLLHHDAYDVESICVIPEVEGDKMVEPEVWLYEHMLRLVMDLNHLVVALQPLCTRTTCPEMRASEWLYICAAHSTAEECCAIDYIVHAIDGATTLLNSNRYFPSRIAIPETSLRLFTSIARRLYRIFAHAYFHHRETFDHSEGDTALYARFMLLIQKYDLIDSDSLIIPSLP